MHLALATCRDLPDWEVDDRPLHAALLEAGFTLAHPAWDDVATDWSAFDAVLIRTTWDYMERRDDFVAWAERVESVSRLFNPAAIVRRNTHKSYLRDLESAGVKVAPTRWLDAGTTADIAALLAETGWTRAFIKPVIGATARETLRFEAEPAGVAAAQAHVDRLLPTEGLMVQPYLARVETDGEVSALFFDGAYSHGVRKVPVAGDYRVQDDFGARDEPYRFDGPELEAAAAAVAAAPAAHGVDAELLYARADFLRDDDGGLLLTELELVEPSLFLRHDAGAAARLAEALRRRLR